MSWFKKRDPVDPSMQALFIIEPTATGYAVKVWDYFDGGYWFEAEFSTLEGARAAIRRMAEPTERYNSHGVKL